MHTFAHRRAITILLSSSLCADNNQQLPDSALPSVPRFLTAGNTETVVKRRRCCRVEFSHGNLTKEM